MRYVYLSPHPDDAALSAAGLIHDLTQTGNAVEIWNLFCGFPPEGELSPFRKGPMTFSRHGGVAL